MQSVLPSKKSGMLFFLSLFLLVFVLPALAPESASLEACPMCKAAIETEGSESQPRAYMASILTMLAMPALLFSIIGVALYRISEHEKQIADEIAEEAGLASGQG